MLKQKKKKIKNRGKTKKQYFALIYHVIDNYVPIREKYRAEHIKIARAAHERGELILGGAFAAPVDQALLIFHVTGRALVEDFAKQDPYVIHGLVTGYEIRPWTVVIGGSRG